MQFLTKNDEFCKLEDSLNLVKHKLNQREGRYKELEERNIDLQKELVDTKAEEHVIHII